MKTKITTPLFFVLITVLGNVTPAQITITSSDVSAINTVGRVATIHLDSITTSVNIGSPGATSWDFSTLNSQFTSTYTSVVPSSTPYFESDFPGSNVVFHFNLEIIGTAGEGWAYSTQTADKYERNGEALVAVTGTDSTLLKVVYSPAQLDIPLPFTYNSQWGSDFTSTQNIYYNGVPLFTITENHTETVIADAWGNLTLPGGVVLQALRVRRDDRYTSISPPSYVRRISYSFLTKSGAAVEITAADTSAPNSGVIQTDGITWKWTTAVGIENESAAPGQYLLSQNYPNPFNPSTIIQYQVPISSFITINVYNILGAKVASLVNEEKPTGTYELIWNAASLPSGVYFYRIQAGNFIQTKKMILLK